MVIDFHCHTFPEKIAARTVKKLAAVAKMKAQTDGSMSDLLRSMERNQVDYAVNLPVMTDPNQVEKIHSSFIRDQEALMAQHIIPFGGMHPDYADYKKELHRLKDAGIKGIKLHPAYQNIDLDDIRMMRIIDAASDLDLITVLHSGIDIGIYDHNYSSVAHTLKVLDEVQPQKLVLAHMGNWKCWDEVEAYLCGAPVWFDTACSIGPIEPDPDSEGLPIYTYNLEDDQFVRIVKKHGADRILFATDSPWADQGDYSRRIGTLDLSKEEKRQIFSANALSLLGME